jgi:hypothetical protein
MCLNETNSAVSIGKKLSEKFPIQNCLKEGDALSPLLFKYALVHTIRRAQEDHEWLKLNGRHEFLVCADDINIMGENTDATKKKHSSAIER